MPFPGSARVAAGPRNPPTLGHRWVGPLTGDGLGWTIEGKLYRGRPLGLVRYTHVSAEVFKIGWFLVRE